MGTWEHLPASLLPLVTLLHFKLTKKNTRCPLKNKRLLLNKRSLPRLFTVRRNNILLCAYALPHAKTALVCAQTLSTRVLLRTKSRVEPDLDAAQLGAVTSKRRPAGPWETASTDVLSPRPFVRSTVSKRHRANHACPTCFVPRVLFNRRSTSSATDLRSWHSL